MNDQLDSVKEVYDFLIEQDFSKETTYTIINLLNYLNTKKIPKKEKRRWIQLDILSKNGSIMLGENDGELDQNDFVMFGMVWDGLLYREFDENKKSFIYDNTRKGDQKADVDPNRFQSEILKSFIFGCKSNLEIANKLCRSEKRINEELRLLRKKGLVAPQSSPSVVIKS